MVVLFTNILLSSQFWFYQLFSDLCSSVWVCLCLWGAKNHVLTHYNCAVCASYPAFSWKEHTFSNSLAQCGPTHQISVLLGFSCQVCQCVTLWQPCFDNILIDAIDPVYGFVVVANDVMSELLMVLVVGPLKSNDSINLTYCEANSPTFVSTGTLFYAQKLVIRLLFRDRLWRLVGLIIIFNSPCYWIIQLFLASSTSHNTVTVIPMYIKSCIYFFAFWRCEQDVKESLYIYRNVQNSTLILNSYYYHLYHYYSL